ncbi:hypothetical protein HHL16_13410 [Pseudoflavitalea sp. G-6-1-2]|uniref:hypothetical protein n=1 Tax=Pseudoflavitalea sp. G-6-1-2 TaxID=2728841 RepID=UPI00146BA797|nr:hypothetical protein [Pseudoflavitalea sp. G-6-1-2]NML21882.1 hypothetical protein [Pseudoflavitalea sp. G-6-1-2]
MFNLFKKGDAQQPPEWLQELNETRDRWYAFLDKLEQRMEELCTEAVPELKQLMATDEDQYKRTFLKVQAGIRGQLQNIRSKASEVYDEKVNAMYYRLNDQVSVLDDNHNLLSQFRNDCSDRYHSTFDQKLNYWLDQIAQTSARDLEIEYKQIIDEFDSIKDKFTCKQCGGGIRIEKIFLISTYIACPHCQTQNTFEPGTQSRSLQYIARELAEQRTQHLYQAYKKEEALEREIYHINHKLELSLIHEKDKKRIQLVDAEMALNEARRQQSISDAPKLHMQYLRAMYDEWNNITPDLKEHNEKMYQNEVAHIQHRSI